MLLPVSNKISMSHVCFCAFVLFYFMLRDLFLQPILIFSYKRHDVIALHDAWPMGINVMLRLLSRNYGKNSDLTRFALDL